MAKLKQHNKDKYEKNKEEILAKCKTYREGEKREEILAKKREWNRNNSDRGKEIVVCEYGITSLKNHLPRHKRTQQHLKLMEAHITIKHY